MASAVATPEAPVKKYVMPHCVVGERVLFYTGADRNMPAQFGTVVEVGGCDVAIRIMSFFGDDRKMIGVCHVSDPRLNNPNIKANGSWEFHPDTLLLKNLLERVKVLEELK